MQTEWLEGEEWHQRRMAGMGARATIANLLQEGMVLDTKAIGEIFYCFGLENNNAILNLKNLVDYKSELLAKRIGVQIGRSYDWRPGIFWDMAKYQAVESAFDGYYSRRQEVHDFLRQLRQW